MTTSLARVLFAILCVVASTSFADVAGFYRGVTQDVYLEIALPAPGDSAGDPACQLGLDCGPPYTSPAVHALLEQWLPSGTPVSVSQLMNAVLAQSLAHTHLADVNVALRVVPTPVEPTASTLFQPGPGPTVLPYQRPAQSRRAIERVLMQWYTPGNASSGSPVLDAVEQRDVSDAVCARFISLALALDAVGRPVARFAAGGLASGPALVMQTPAAFEIALLDRLVALGALPHRETRLVFEPPSASDDGVPRHVYVALSEIGAGAVWRGNLKKLRLLQPARGSGEDMEGETRALQVVDARGDAALIFDEHVGLQLRDSALGLWTHPAALSPGDGKYVFPGADGQSVARGGAGQGVPGFLAIGQQTPAIAGSRIGDSNSDSDENAPVRQVFTLDSAGVDLVPLDANADGVARLRPWAGLSGRSPEQVLDLLRWARGQDTRVASGESRDWLFGDLSASQPVAVNYGALAGSSSASPTVRLFFGSGDGIFRIVQASVPPSDFSPTVEAGSEVFAFMPPEMFATLSERRDNVLSGLATRPRSRKLPGVAGPLRVAVHDGDGDGAIDASAGDHVRVYFGLGGSGSAYYALDVSDPLQPPRLLWRVVGGAGDFAELGYAVSAPVPIQVVVEGHRTDAIAFGGGITEEGDGGALFIVDALDGSLIWKAIPGPNGLLSGRQFEHLELTASVAAPVAPLRDAQGVTNRLYVGDVEGNVWRVDLEPGRPWTLRKLAALGVEVDTEVSEEMAVDTNGVSSGHRVFFDAVDVVRSVDALGPFEGVIVASGDVENPAERDDQNYLFYLKDRLPDLSTAVSGTASAPDAERPALALSELPDLSDCADSASDDSSCTAFTGEFGWKLALQGEGEKALGAPVVDGGTVYLSTYLPRGSGECSGGLGAGRLYRVALFDAAPVEGSSRFSELGPGPPPPVERVGNLLYLPGPVDVDSEDPTDAFEPHLIPSEATRILKLYWTEHGVDAL